ncbi:MAG: family 20 glycosylhydrolase, partial [Prevotellaceae bacterium]|nr:family 20 glycosylhydrolase [Prevotellaceae bacterium]
MKTTKKSLFSCSGLLLLAAGCAPHNVNVVPEPVEIQPLSGHFTLTESTPLVFQNVAENSPVASYIKEYFATHFGIENNAASGNAGNSITFSIAGTADPSLHEEGYELLVNESGITVKANSEAGLVYALQTLYQLAPAKVTKEKPATVAIPAVAITDYPRFEWRGSHLDVSRHFFDVDYVKKHLDVMALFKLNKFHWHLTDDHGWRIQIDKYPKLTEIGAWRPDRSNVGWLEAEPPKEGEPATYGGFYTKAQIRDVIAYAAQRNIEVI